MKFLTFIVYYTCDNVLEIVGVTNFSSYRLRNQLQSIHWPNLFSEYKYRFCRWKRKNLKHARRFSITKRSLIRQKSIMQPTHKTTVDTHLTLFEISDFFLHGLNGQGQWGVVGVGDDLVGGHVGGWGQVWGVRRNKRRWRHCGHRDDDDVATLLFINYRKIVGLSSSKSHFWLI